MSQWQIEHLASNVLHWPLVQHSHYMENDIYTEQVYLGWYPMHLQPWQYPSHSHWSTCPALVNVS